MTRFTIFVLLTMMTALGAQTITPPPPSDTTHAVTFNKDVLPILQKNCQVCHRQGGVAPMSFLTYESTRPWAKAIKAAVLSRKMPPWFADPHYGGFRNAPALTQDDIKMMGAWVDSGAREGDAADLPAAVHWVDGWRIQPDVIVSMPEPHHIAAKGAGEIKEFLIPSPFAQDTWVTSIEIRPGNPSVVHHVIVQVPETPVPKGFAWGALNCFKCPPPFQAKQPEDKPKTRGKGGSYPGGSDEAERLAEPGAFTTMEAVYAPGSPPLDFRFHDSAKLIRGGKQIRIEVHYTPNGNATTDQTMVGFTLAKNPARRRFVIMAPTSLADVRRPIPAGESNWEITGELTFNQEAELVWFMPHMHLRGKDMTFDLVYPNGREETVLRANFNFQWQLGYDAEDPIKVPKGTKMIITAHYDNSANNLSNPDPTKAARWGELTSDEMMLPWFGVLVNRDTDPGTIASYRPGGVPAIESLLPARSPATPGLHLPVPTFGTDIIKPPVLRREKD